MKDKKCSVYEERPEQRGTWPYWKRIMEKKKDLLRETAYCKGIFIPQLRIPRALARG